MGAFVVTMAMSRRVPMNNALEAGTGPARAAVGGLLARWQRWNVIRGLASLLALGVAAAGLLLW
ncbi:anthrone oxygenase family protein [Nonomuraea dietziae]|uniref:anthrone oxygenase family protein n=1 Tax=Nonomuraea dietziae TaxID=65515 RepID=UPI0031D1DC82